MDGTEYIMCPLVDQNISHVDCMENSDAVDGILKKETVPERFRQKADWEKICRKCQWHNF